ncbi:hypothetical protein GCM10010317_059680 [Streptomyces mirabilis]|nr:hypothetical protein GCM10010317_059680 [Streptomyces mirabilis]
MAQLVASRQEKALDLLLLVYAVTVKEDFSTSHWSTTWARAINGSYDERSASAQISRLWRQLESHKLITRRQSGRQANVRKLREDGTGNPYTRPVTDKDGLLSEVYFKLPYEYWDSNWHNRLTLPAKAVLFIAMSLRKPEFTLPDRWTSEWYGISEATVTRGRAKLEAEGIIAVAREETTSSLKEMHGFGKRIYYRLEDPFNRNIRNGLTQPSPMDPSSGKRKVIIRSIRPD